MRLRQKLQEMLSRQFEKIYGHRHAKGLGKEEAARLLGMGTGTWRCYADRFEQSGLEKLIDKR